MRNCITVWEVYDGWWMGMGVGATPTVREGVEERGIAQWGRRWEVDNCVFPFTSRGELAGGLRCRSGYYSHKRAGMAT